MTPKVWSIPKLKKAAGISLGCSSLYMLACGQYTNRYQGKNLSPRISIRSAIKLKQQLEDFIGDGIVLYEEKP
jgi:hypothetical protein